MKLAVDVSVGGERVPLSRVRIEEVARRVLAAERVRDALVSVTFVSARRMALLNRRHLGHAGATDVISFGFRRATPRDPVVGDIYIAPSVARENAGAAGVGVREEIARLVVHGVLHVLGYDHPEGPGRETSAMWRRQEVLLARLLARRS